MTRFIAKTVRKSGVVRPANPGSAGLASSIYHLVYVSYAGAPLSTLEMMKLLDTARERNLRAGISGLMFHHRGLFFQLLEGPRERVEEIMTSIARDPRHAGISYLVRGSNPTGRIFSVWAMGFFELNPLTEQNLSTLNTEEMAQILAILQLHPDSPAANFMASLMSLNRSVQPVA